MTLSNWHNRSPKKDVSHLVIVKYLESSLKLRIGPQRNIVSNLQYYKDEQNLKTHYVTQIILSYYKLRPCATKEICILAQTSSKIARDDL
jgi:hypothetical protein